jgi:predicted O-linked N-acetylglucosamine transferase (SPINDLY family)
MGVPTLTLAGNTLLARQGASLMTAGGLPDWVVDTPAAYVEKAVAFASDLPALVMLRAGLREKVAASPLFDGQLFARHFEQALYGMWDQYNLKG